MYSYCYNNPIVYDDLTGYGVFPVSGFGTLYYNYKAAVLAWSTKYALMSDGVEYGAIIYSIRVLFWTYYFMGETYQGYKTTNWYTVINGLGAGYLVGSALKKLGFWLFTSFQIIGFAHTHPIGHNNQPSGPDIWMKRIGFIVAQEFFLLRFAYHFANMEDLNIMQGSTTFKHSKKGFLC